MCRYNEASKEMLLACINWEETIWAENQSAVRAMSFTAD